MRVLLVGCTGFIGRALVKRLVDAGHECFVLLRSHKSVAPNFFPAAAHLTPFGERPAEIDAVINLAGESIAGGWTPKRKKLILDSRTDTTHELVQWMSTLARKPIVFLCASAVGFYGDEDGREITESSGPDPKRRFLAQVCILWEQEANAARMLGVRVINLRFGQVMDPTGGFVGELVARLKLAPFLVPFASNVVIPWISLRDAAHAIEFAMTNEAVAGPVNVVSPNAVTYRDFFKSLGKALSKPVFGRLPTWILKLILAEFAEAILSSQRVIPDKLSKANFGFEDPELEPFLLRRFAEIQKVTSSRPVK